MDAHCRIRLKTKNEKGEQFGFSTAEGCIKGHVDGVIHSFPEELASAVQEKRVQCHASGGAEGSRTPDLDDANVALYQLSYDPT